MKGKKLIILPEFSLPLHWLNKAQQVRSETALAAELNDKVYTETKVGMRMEKLWNFFLQTFLWCFYKMSLGKDLFSWESFVF